MTISTSTRHYSSKIEIHLGFELDSQGINKFGPIYEKINSCTLDNDN